MTDRRCDCQRDTAMTPDKRHGGPYDRGSADRYYGRLFRPHYFLGKTGQSREITALSDEELAEYKSGWNEETDRKDYG